MSQSALTFDDGKTALLRDPRQVPVKLRRPHDHAKMALSTTAVEVQDRSTDEKVQQKLFALAVAAQPELAERINDTAILALVAEWGYGEVTQTVLEELPGQTYDRLVEVCSDLSPKMSPNFQVSPDPKATTGESSDSEKSGTAEAITSPATSH